MTLPYMTTLSFIFLFHKPSLTEFYTLSLHDALPICKERHAFFCHGLSLSLGGPSPLDETLLHKIRRLLEEHGILYRSEEHTSELQSLRHLVCRLLLEKKKRDDID